jgi:L-alanine-DL-glutamate epimerase-like enolase superfamily enzyme
MMTEGAHSNGVKITDVRAHPFDIPLTEPFTISAGSITSTRGVLVVVDTSTGLRGLGEATPVYELTGEFPTGIIHVVNEIFRPLMIGKNPFRLEDIADTLDKAVLHNTSAKAAVEMALYDVIGKALGVAVYDLLGGENKTVITDISLGIGNPAKVAKLASEAISKGFTLVKVKVGGNPADDLERVKAVREAVGPSYEIKVDANQGWTVRAALRAIRALEKYEIQLVEQPIAAWNLNGLVEIRRKVEVPIMVDESVFSPQDAHKVVALGAADMINIKLMKCGGISRGKRIAAIAEAAGLECMIGSMYESRLSLTAAAHLATSTRAITMADIDAALLSRDPVDEGILFEGGRVRLPGGPGLGVTLKSELPYLE